jgi:uncharacterized protein (TIGR00369 family)
MIVAVPTRTAAELTAHLHTSFPPVRAGAGDGNGEDGGGAGDGGPGGNGGEGGDGGDGRLVVTDVDDDSIRLTMRTDRRHLRPGATVSGPTLFSLVDTAAWLMTLARLEPGREAVTAGVSMQFLRRPPAGELVALGRLLRLGRRLSVVDVVVHGVVEPDGDPAGGPDGGGPPDGGDGPPAGDGRIGGPPALGPPLVQATVTYAPVGSA